MQDFTNIIVPIGEFIGIVVLAILYVKSRIPKQTIEEQTKLIGALQDRVKLLEQLHEVNNEKIAKSNEEVQHLKGQIAVYKEIPLQQIAASLKALEHMPKDIERIHKASNKSLIDALKVNKLRPAMA